LSPLLSLDLSRFLSCRCPAHRPARRPARGAHPHGWLVRGLGQPCAL